MVRKTVTKGDVSLRIDVEPVQFEWNPELNHTVISIVKQNDGNYKGFTFKNGHYIEVRQGDPNTVLQLLITHE